MKKFILFVCTLILTKTMAQTHTLNAYKVCSFSYNEEVKNSCENVLEIKYEEMKSSDTLEKSIYQVLSANGLHQQNLSIGILNNRLIAGMYCKPQFDPIAKILIGKDYLNNYWIAMGILFHELGHSLNHHENLCSNPQLELDADLFSGRCLALMGATKEQAVECLSIDNVDIISSLYPSKNDRINQFLTGYKSFFNVSSTLSFTSMNPRVRWIKLKDHNEVYINEKKIILPIVKGYWKVDSLAIEGTLGILYINSTNSTYQLYNYKDSKKGIGELVNDRTPITYMRFGKNSFRIYNKAKIIPFKEVLDTISTSNGKDYEIFYKVNTQDKEFTRIVFVDYFFTPKEILRPAFYK